MMKHPIDPDSRIVGFRLHVALHRRLKTLCAAHDMTLQEVFSQAIIQWLATAEYKASSLQAGRVAAGYTQLSTAPETRP